MAGLRGVALPVVSDKIYVTCSTQRFLHAYGCATQIAAGLANTAEEVYSVALLA